MLKVIKLKMNIGGAMNFKFHLGHALDYLIQSVISYWTQLKRD